MVKQVLIKILKTASLAMLLVVMIASVLFGDLASANALSPEANGDNPMGIVIEPSEDSQEINEKETDLLKTRTYNNEHPDLGDDQVFPFAAGLDSY